MNVSDGLMDGQVLQRNAINQGCAVVKGSAGASGTVFCRVLAGPASLKKWGAAGKAAKGRWRANLKKLPAGGPYKVEFRIGNEYAAVKDVFVGDVWILAGQSNMQGIGNLKDAPKPHPMVRCFYMRDEWAIADEPIHFIPEAVDEVHINRAMAGQRMLPAEVKNIRELTVKGVGPGVFFAKIMRNRTGVPQGLIACAHGGTSMAEWSPLLRKKGGASFYGAMLRRFRKLGQPVAGVLWYQGCSDAQAECVGLYTKRMKELVRSVRRDFKLPRLPWAVVQIGRVVGRDEESGRLWNNIQEQQRKLPELIPHVDVVPAIDLNLDDSIHISGVDHARLGARLARVMLRLALGNRDEQPALRFRKARVGNNIKNASGQLCSGIEVSFDNVVGGLCAQGRPYGFKLADAEQNVVDVFFKTTLFGNRVLLESDLSACTLEQFALHYGAGANPYVNLTDARDMAVPVFGPMQIAQASKTPYVVNWEAAALGEITGGLAAFKPSASSAARRWYQPPKKPVLAHPYMIMPAKTSEKRRGIYLFRTCLHAKRALKKLRMAIGSDSAIRIWINGQEAYRNLKAVNPMLPDQYTKTVQLQKGINHVLVGFDARAGRGWGFSLRFLALDKKGALPVTALQPGAACAKGRVSK